jgi:hypothetical protein
MPEMSSPHNAERAPARVASPPTCASHTMSSSDLGRPKATGCPAWATISTGPSTRSMSAHDGGGEAHGVADALTSVVSGSFSCAGASPILGVGSRTAGSGSTSPAARTRRTWTATPTRPTEEPRWASLRWDRSTSPHSSATASTASISTGVNACREIHPKRGPRACRGCAAGCASDAHDHRERRADGTPRRAERRQRRQIAGATVLDIYFCNSPPPASAAPTRTPTASCASTSPQAPTCPCTAGYLDYVAAELNRRAPQAAQVENRRRRPRPVALLTVHTTPCCADRLNPPSSRRPERERGRK